MVPRKVPRRVSCALQPPERVPMRACRCARLLSLSALSAAALALHSRCATHCGGPAPLRPVCKVLLVEHAQAAAYCTAPRWGSPHTAGQHNRPPNIPVTYSPRRTLQQRYRWRSARWPPARFAKWRASTPPNRFGPGPGLGLRCNTEAAGCISTSVRRVYQRMQAPPR